jgi:hypothetical protein
MIEQHYGLPGWDCVLTPWSERAPRAQGLANKPTYAFWTSPEREDGSGGWGNWCRDNEFNVGDALYRFERVGSPRILTLATSHDLIEAAKAVGAEVIFDALTRFRSREEMEAARGVCALLTREMGATNTVLAYPWDEIANQYDAVYVPADFDYWSLLYGWDCESMAWFRPWEHLRPAEKKLPHLIQMSEDSTGQQA